MTAVEIIQKPVETGRAIFRCKNKSCKHVWAYDYTSEYGRPLQRYNIWGRISYYREDVNTDHCPKCNNVIYSVYKVQGKTSERKCNDKCQSATSEICECSCGGKNHGMNHIH